MRHQLSRRALVTGAMLGAAGAALPARAWRADGPIAPPITPDDALHRLEAGNADFTQDKSRLPNLGAARREELARGQAPFCALLSCSDSRVPPDLVFGGGLGDLFIIRNAGNVIDMAVLGSIEYAVAELHVPLIVVMGHENCGAVRSAIAVVERNADYPGVIGNMIEPILPAALAARTLPGDRVENAARAHVRRMTAALRRRADPVLLKPQAEGRLKVVGAYYHLGSGTVDFFDRP
ncbi:carbonic anhydrase [Sphingomonas azotifigens]|uniref:carbonic anhydrase n=1 Tax=Sphingomonas azotifigens TaxID=330920 RepID=UPI000A0638DC|nr:carbonic anhydrase [Sphingomonas azotifigens]